MDWIEVTARTVDDAKELALDRLGVVEDELEFEVVDEPKRKLFGRGDARIRARVKPLSREKPTDRKRRRKPNERSGRAGGQGGGQGGGGRGGQRGGGRSAERSGAAAPRGGNDTTDDERDDAGPSTPRAPGSGTRRRRGGRGRGTGGASGGRAPASDAPGERATHERRDSDERGGRTSDDETQAEVDVETVPVAEQAEQAATFTDELVRTMGFTASVRTEIDGDDVTVHIEGEGLGALVGPKGATIQALQEVVRAVVQRSAGGHSAWIHVDVAGYRERRRRALEEFARQVAAEVKETGEERAMEPMNAADRKIVHDVVAEVDGVDTTSEGEEPRRRVVVFPA